MNFHNRLNQLFYCNKNYIDCLNNPTMDNNLIHTLYVNSLLTNNVINRSKQNISQSMKYCIDNYKSFDNFHIIIPDNKYVSPLRYVMVTKDVDNYLNLMLDLEPKESLHKCLFEKDNVYGDLPNLDKKKIILSYVDVNYQSQSLKPALLLNRIFADYLVSDKQKVCNEIRMILDNSNPNLHLVDNALGESFIMNVIKTLEFNDNIIEFIETVDYLKLSCEIILKLNEHPDSITDEQYKKFSDILDQCEKIKSSNML